MDNQDTKTKLKVLIDWLHSEQDQKVLDVGDINTYVAALLNQVTPDDATRELACRHPATAFWYAASVDKTPRNDTRKASCGNPQYAFRYANGVDRCARDDTRTASCKEPFWAHAYVLWVDINEQRETHDAVLPDQTLLSLYHQRFNRLTGNRAIDQNLFEATSCPYCHV